MLKLTAESLARSAGVGLATVRRFELMSGVPSGNARSLEAIQRALEEAGIEFIGAPDDKPGVRIKSERSNS